VLISAELETKAADVLIVRGLCGAGLRPQGLLVDAGDGVRGMGVSSQAAAGISGSEEEFTAVAGSGIMVLVFIGGGGGFGAHEGDGRNKSWRGGRRWRLPGAKCAFARAGETPVSRAQFTPVAW